MADYQKYLENKLWAVRNEFHGNMELREFKNYILGFIFYRYLSEKLESYLNKELKENGLTFKKAYESDNYKEYLEEKGIETLGYFIKPKFLFSTIVEKAKSEEFILHDLESALTEVSNLSAGHKSQDSFYNIFEYVDLNSLRLGKSASDKNRNVSSILLSLSEIDFESNDGSLSMGDAFEHLISNFAYSEGKKAGEFYTPLYVSKILAKIVSGGKSYLANVFDPTCGSGSLLLRVGDEVGHIDKFYGQELNPVTYNLSRMNMIIHGVGYDNFDIKQGDSLECPQQTDIKFEAIVADPPFSAKWSSDKRFLDDMRFADYGKLAPKSKADYAFVQHMLYHLDENGIMAVVLPHGVLFRGASEQHIRRYIIEKNYLDAVIGLPANIFYNTSIPTCILVFKKHRIDENVLFIDASKYFEKRKSQNILLDDDIDRIIHTYVKREEIERFSHNASISEIIRNDFNLNIPRYVDTFEKEEPVNLDEVYGELKKISKEIEKVDSEIRQCCDKLGIEPPF